MVVRLGDNRSDVIASRTPVVWTTAIRGIIRQHFRGPQGPVQRRNDSRELERPKITLTAGEPYIGCPPLMFFSIARSKASSPIAFCMPGEHLSGLPDLDLERLNADWSALMSGLLDYEPWEKPQKGQPYAE